MLGALGVGPGLLVVAHQLAQFLPVGAGQFDQQGLDGVVALVDDAVAPALGAMVALDRLLVFLFQPAEGCRNRVNVAGAE